MGWVLRLVRSGTEDPSDGVDVLEIDRPDDLGDLADLGLTLSEGKHLLAGTVETLGVRQRGRAGDVSTLLSTKRHIQPIPVSQPVKLPTGHIPIDKPPPKS